MKKIRLNKYLSFVFIPVLLIALLLPVNAFASQANSSMEVIAHIEAPSDEASFTANTNTDSKSPPTGNDSNLDILTPFLFISSGVLTVTAMRGKRNNIKQIKQ